MSHGDAAGPRERIDALYRSESRRVLATLIRLLGDFDLAEEALQDAFAAAMEQWPRDGTPANPRAWLVSTGRFRAIDRLRRRARFEAMLGELAARLEQAAPDPAERDHHLEDDRLRLIFTCCHPALPPGAQVAMTLREVCGLTTEEIARNRPTEISQARGLAGRPSRGHCSTAAVKASWSASSARSKSPSRRMRVARTRRDSDR